MIFGNGFIGWRVLGRVEVGQLEVATQDAGQLTLLQGSSQGGGGSFLEEALTLMIWFQDVQGNLTWQVEIFRDFPFDEFDIQARIVQPSAKTRCTVADAATS